MEIIKRKISLEPSIDRNYNSQTWGSVTAETFYVNVFITQNIDNMGLFTDLDFISANTTNQSSVDYTLLINKLSSLGYSFPFMNGSSVGVINPTNQNEYSYIRFIDKEERDYYDYGNNKLSGLTCSRIDELKSYDSTTPYKLGLDIFKEIYINYNDNIIDGVSRVLSVGEPNIYTFDAENNANIGTNNQTTGLLYEDYSATTLNNTLQGGDFSCCNSNTIVKFLSEGKNKTNTSLSAITKEEYLFGIISPPETESSVFIDRGVTTVMELHLKLSEVKSLGELSRYGNGFYNIRKT